MRFLLLLFVCLVVCVGLAAWFVSGVQRQLRRLLARLTALEGQLGQVMAEVPSPVGDPAARASVASPVERALQDVGQAPDIWQGRFELPNGEAFAVAVDARWFDPIIAAAMIGERWVIESFYPLLDLIQPGDRVLDVGAHIGSFSLAAATLGAQVVSVEAAPKNVALLHASVALNGLDRMRVVHSAASDHDGMIEFLPHGPWGTIANPAVIASPELIQAKRNVPVRVPAVTLDGLLGEVGWADLDVLKIDIEGSEVAALRGMERLLRACDDLLIFYECNVHTLRFFGETPATLRGLLERFGYSSFIPRAGRLVPVEPYDYQPECVINYLAMKRPHPRLGAWQIVAPRSVEQTIATVLKESSDVYWYSRAHIARSLREAPSAIALDHRVIAALVRLGDDPDPRVRAEAAWFAE